MWAREALEHCKKLGGDSRDVRDAMGRLKSLEKEQRARERALYGGKIQKTSVHKTEEALVAKADARKAIVYNVLYAFGLPLILPMQILLRAARAFGRLTGLTKEKAE